MDESDFFGIGGMDGALCLDHLTDPAIRAQLQDDCTEVECFACGKIGASDEEPFAVGMDALGEVVWEAANWLYQWTENIDWVDGEPWSYEALYETPEVIYDTVEGAVDPEYSERIIDALVAATTATEYWVASGRSSAETLGWDAFAATVRTEARFTLIGSSTRPGFENEPPARVAAFLETLLAYVESDLLVELPKGSVLYRGRMAERASDLYARVRREPSSELGSPPSHLAEANRLSARGISMFYAADDLDIAVAEIALHSQYNEAVVGAFRTCRPFRILDFTRPLTTLPSIFATDAESRKRWVFSRFKTHFTDMITAPVLLDGRESLDYTPTQVVAEWLRWVPDTRIDGIAWPSHLASPTQSMSPDEVVFVHGADSQSPEGKNIVLFFRQGSDFQSDPPTPAEMNRQSRSDPALTLSLDDVSLHRAFRSVAVATLEKDDWDGDEVVMMGRTIF